MPYLPMISVVALWIAIANAHDRVHSWCGGAYFSQFMLYSRGVFNSIFAVDLGVFPSLSNCHQGFSRLVAVGILIYCSASPFSALPKLQWPHLSNAGRTMWRNFVPSALGAGRMQLNLLVDLILASLLPVGAISWLYYADRVAQLPLGIVGIALGTALLPRLSTAHADGQRTDFIKALGEAIIFAGFCCASNDQLDCVGRPYY